MVKVGLLQVHTWQKFGIVIVLVLLSGGEPWLGLLGMNSPGMPSPIPHSQESPLDTQCQQCEGTEGETGLKYKKPRANCCTILLNGGAHR